MIDLSVTDMNYKELNRQIEILNKKYIGKTFDSFTIKDYKEKLEQFYEQNKKEISDDDLLRKYKELTYDSMILANTANSIITGLSVSAMMIVINGCLVIKYSIILLSIEAILLLLVIFGSLLSNRLYSSNRRYYYNNVHRNILKTVLEKRDISYAL